MVTLKPFVCADNAQNTVVHLAQQQWGHRGHLLVAMDRRGMWHDIGSEDGPPPPYATSGRSLWYLDRERALHELARLRAIEAFPSACALSGMVELAEGLVVALEPV
jgi:hypothetical protein